MSIPDLFNKYPWLSQKEVARRTAISYTKLRQYRTGAAQASNARRLIVLEAVKLIGQELAKIKVK